MGLFDDILKGLPVNSVLREQVSQLNAQKAAADEQNAILKDDLREAKAEIAQLKKQVEELAHKDDLDLETLEVLKAVSDLGERAYIGFLERALSSMRPQVIRYHLENLKEAEYLRFGVIHRMNGAQYVLTQKARKLLLDRGLL